MSLETQSNPADRRLHPRRVARGQVKLQPEGVGAASAYGQMVDISSSGFRARHSFATLSSGQIVQFSCGSLEGRARVVWTRIAAGHVESGFLILAS